MKLLEKKLLYLSWSIAFFAFLGSLYFSEVRRFTPCVLCWYQRIFMYPLVLLIMLGILRNDRGVYIYVLPMSILGGLIAFYHVLLEKGVLPENIAPCTLGASCSIKYVGYFGFITIPVMSFTAFSAITICMLIYRRIKK